MLAMKEEEGSQGGDELEEKGEGEGGDGVNGEGENYDGLKEAYLKMCFLVSFGLRRVGIQQISRSNRFCFLVLSYRSTLAESILLMHVSH